jgi:hypothetical protein
MIFEHIHYYYSLIKGTKLHWSLFDGLIHHFDYNSPNGLLLFFNHRN